MRSQMAVDDMEAVHAQDLSAVAHLAQSERYKSIMQVCSSAARQQQTLCMPEVLQLHLELHAKQALCAALLLAVVPLELTACCSGKRVAAESFRRSASHHLAS